jgi:hypothetical protein
MAQHLRDRMNKWNCIKLKDFYTTKETVSRLKRLPTEWKKIFASSSADKRLISRIYIQGTQKTQPLKNQHTKEEIDT